MHANVVLFFSEIMCLQVVANDFSGHVIPKISFFLSWTPCGSFCYPCLGPLTWAICWAKPNDFRQSRKAETHVRLYTPAYLFFFSEQILYWFFSPDVYIRRHLQYNIIYKGLLALLINDVFYFLHNVTWSDFLKPQCWRRVKYIYLLSISLKKIINFPQNSLPIV